MKNRLMSILLALFILLTFTTFFNIFHLKVSQSNTRPSSLASDVLSLSSILLQSEENLSTQSTLISSNIDLHDSISLKGPPPQRSISWKEFVKSAPLILPRQEADRMIKQWGHFDDLNYCPKKIVDVLRKPGLSNIEYEWCKWTLNPDGGKVKVGTSYGKLNSPERDKYEQLGCNSVANGNNPSCDHGWGDLQIQLWRDHPMGELCGKGRSSKVKCMDSQSNARFCIFENTMLDFSKMTDIKRPGLPDSRKWEKGFLATDCDQQAHPNIDYYEFYGPVVNSTSATCDHVFSNPVLLYSHDEVHNLGHTMSDLMNVFAMLWLSGLGPHAHSVSFLNVDAIREGASYRDETTPFFQHYELNFKNILKASQFKPDAKLCFKQLVFMPRPLLLFVWDGWWQDMKCSFVGPSSLFQRFNMQIRNSYDLLKNGPNHWQYSTKLRVLLIIRRKNAISGDMNPKYSSRIFSNEAEIQSALQSLPNVELLSVDLAMLNFTAQVQLMNEVGLVIGMHGAGIAGTMHMPVGSPNCCGVVEIFPPGEFINIRGYGNMARKMGHHYERLNVPSNAIPITPLIEIVHSVIEKIRTGPSCILPSVISDPYFLAKT